MEMSNQTVNLRPGIKLSRSIIISFLVLLFLIPAGLTAKPTSSGQAKKAVAEWLKLDPAPLRTNLGKQTDKIDEFADANGTVLYYVVYLQPRGFVIVSADDMVEPIIGFVPMGSYDPSDDNPLGALVNSDLPGRIAAVRKLQADANNQTQKKIPTKQSDRQAAFQKAVTKARNKWNKLQGDYSGDPIDATDPSITASTTVVSDVRVAPLVQSKWGQTDVYYGGPHCYNYYTPNYYPSGCVATAMAQVMRFFEYPETGIGVHSFTISVNGVSRTASTRGGNGSGGAYNWGLMMLDPYSDWEIITQSQRQAIGALCYDAGVSVYMEYTYDGSGAWVEDAMYALVATFGYNNVNYGCNYYNNKYNNIGAGLNGMVNPNLDAGYPVILGITDSGENGHAIVTDGYGYNTSTLYHHLNMGWSGLDDAWYNLPDVDCDPPYNIVDECLYNIFVSGLGEIISGRVTNSSGLPITNATVTAERVGGGSYGTVTNSNGIYALAKIPSASSYTVSVTKQGYTFTSQLVTTATSIDGENTSGNRWGINFVGTIAQPAPPTAFDGNASAEAGVAKPIQLQAGDDGFPNPPGTLTYIIESLPGYGTLADPAGGMILSLPYTLAGNGNQVIYTPNNCCIGSDSFEFKANDGGNNPSGGNSNIATITIDVQPPPPLTIYQTDFEAGLPQGWSIVDGLSDGETWNSTNPSGQSSSYWTGTFMIVDSDYAGYVNMDEQLITHTIDCSTLLNVTLRFMHYFKDYSESEEVADVDVSIDGGAHWQNVARYQGTDVSGLEILDLSSIADGKANVKIRWHYYNANYAWYWGIDDVEISASTLPDLIDGDFERDCDVDFVDLKFLASQWLSDVCDNSNNWCGGADFEPDGNVDFADFARLAVNWLEGTD